jgi:hypothetical protein
MNTKDAKTAKHVWESNIPSNSSGETEIERGKESGDARYRWSREEWID